MNFTYSPSPSETNSPNHLSDRSDLSDRSPNGFDDRARRPEVAAAQRTAGDRLQPRVRTRACSRSQLRRRRRSSRLAPALLLTACLTLLAGSGAIPVPGSQIAAASASVHGRMINFGGWLVGTFQLDDGKFVYCIEPGAMPPYSSQQGPAVVEELRGYSIDMSDITGWSGRVSTSTISGEPLRRINYLLANYGDTENADIAAAVQFAIWMLRDGHGETAWLNHHFDWVVRYGGAWHMDHARLLVSEAVANARSATVAAPDPLDIRVAGAFGSGLVSYPAGTTELRIEGGRFSNGSRVLAVTGGEAGEARWRADMHAGGWRGSSSVRLTGEWSLPASGWPAQVELYPSVVPNEQTLTWAVGPVTEMLSGEFVPVQAIIDAQFAPTLTTQVPEVWAPQGEAFFSDRVTLGVAPGSNPWPTRAGVGGALEYFPVLAEGVVFGPFEQPQVPSGTAPVGAPIAGRATLLADVGPGEYAVESVEMPTQAGYYYWVWSIDEAGQPAAHRESGVLPAQYGFVDDFGLEAEGQITSTRLRWSTELLSRELTATSLMIQDRVIATVENGTWLRDGDSERIPARLRLSVYGSTDEPERQALVPHDAEELAVGHLEVDEEHAAFLSEPLELPAGTRGWVTVQTCLFAEDQEPELRGYIEEWCDDYGVPAETARIVEPMPLPTTGGSGYEALVVGAVILGGAGGLALLIGARRRIGRAEAAQR